MNCRIRTLMGYYIMVIWVLALLLGNADAKKRKSRCENLSDAAKKNCLGQAFLSAVQEGKIDEMYGIIEDSKRMINFLVLAYTDKRVGMQNGFTGLLWAAYKNNTKLVNILVEMGSNVNQSSNDISNFTPIYFTSQHGNQNATNLLLKNKSVVNVSTYNGFTPLLIAAWNGHSAIVRTLLEKKADPNSTSKETGYFALYFAAKQGKLDMVNYLLEHNANIDMQTHSGDTALLTATSWGWEEIVSALLRANPDITLEDQYGSTVFHRAANYGYTGILRKLILSLKDTEKSLVDKQNIDGRTALHMVSLKGRLDTLNELLKACPKESIKDKAGLTPLDIAIKMREKLAAKARNTKAMDVYISTLGDYRSSSCK